MNLYVAGGVAVALVLALAGAHHAGVSSGQQTVQAKWDAATLDAQTSEIESLGKLNAALVQSRAETEAIRQNYIDFKAGAKRETDALERAVAAGSKRLSVNATCPVPPSLPTAGATAGRAAGGTAILDANAERSYYAYRRAYDEQFATLKLCRDELIKRSSK